MKTRNIALFAAMIPTLLPHIASAQVDREIVETVVVTATRTERNVLEVPASVSVQDMGELYAGGFFSSPDELRGVPGVFFRRGEGDNDEFPSVTIRGVTGNHGNDTFLALVDGIPFISGDEEVLLSQVPFAAVDQIEIVRGPVSALYGRGGISGAIHYRTRSPQQNATHLSMTAGSDDYYRAGLTVERNLGAQRFLVDLTHEESGGWRESNERRLSNIFAKGEFDISSDTTVTAFLNYGDRRHEVGSVIPTLADGTPLDVLGGREGALLYNDPYSTAETVMGALRLNHSVNEDLDIQVTGHVRRVDNFQRLNFYDSWLFDPDNNIFGINGFESDGTTDAGFLEATATWQVGRHNIVAGGNIERVDSESRNYWSGQHGFTFECDFQFYAIQINYRTGEIVNGDHPCFVRDLKDDTDTTNQFWSMFVQDEIELTDALTLTLGARYDAFKRDTTFRATPTTDISRDLTDSESAISPKAALSYDFGNSMVYVAYGRGFSSNFGPIWQWDAEQYERSAKPTTIDSVEVGTKGRAFDRRLTYTLTGFYLEQKNRLTVINNPDPLGPRNLVTTGQLYNVHGVEATAAFNITPRTRLYTSYTWTKPEWKEYEAGDVVLTGLVPTGIPEHMGFVELSYDVTSAVSLKTSWEIYDDYYISRDNEHKGGGYNLVNASATFALPWHDDLNLDVAITNLFDTEYEYLFGNQSAVTHLTPGTPRQWRIGIRASF